MKGSAEFELPLTILQEEVAASDLLTDSYKHFQPLLADGLRFFLERLSAVRLRSIIDEQVRMPLSASTAERVVALLHHVPALHKLGQVVGRDRRLDPVFRKRLQVLESLESQMTHQEITELLDADFPNWQTNGIELGPNPLAEGSVAVVMPFTWRDAPARDVRLRNGVLKLLKPDIEKMLDEDLEILGALGGFLDSESERYHLPRLDYRETFETIRDLLLNEVRFEKEQSHLAEAGRLYASTPSIVIPALHPFCSDRVTAMERIYGHSVGEDGARPGFGRVLRARAIAGALVAQPLFSSEQDALFHADPHAGNLLITPEGRIAILDWSLIGRLSRHDRVQLAQILLGAMTFDTRRIETALEKLAFTRPNRAVMGEIVRARVRELQFGKLPGLDWLTGLIDKIVLNTGIKVNSNLLLFRKTLLTLEGVLSDFSQEYGVSRHMVLDQSLIEEFLYNWVTDWPSRWFTPLTAPTPSTHLSTADALWLLWSAPLTAARWLGIKR